MAKYVTISARILEEKKKEMEKYNLQPTEIIRDAIDNEIKLRKAQEIKQKLETVSSELAKVNPDETAELIREERDKR
ncbi:MAG: CopG family transcriptional regulator [Candidatus Bathyarchaeota archaeon]|nr:CopG family transcriptional regulator [Candidatus Bathyarchaeota archaeon]